jgi:RNA polymerase sigma factor (sigma-70 family)
LTEVELPGLAIRQARFLALNELKRGGIEKRVLAAVPDAPSAPGVADVAASREEIAKVLDALRGCSAQAQKVFRGIYAQGKSASEVATEIGLSLQRVRQILCETRAALKEVVR